MSDLPDTRGTDIDVAELVRQAKAVPSLGRPVPSWQTRMAAVDQGHTCYWCNKTGDALLPGHIINPSCGGTNAAANVIVVCPSCRKRQGRADPLAWCVGSSAKLERRRQALAASLNHPLVQPVRARSAVVRHLDLRWEHPRFMVVLGRTAVLWPIRQPIPAHVAVALRAMGSGLSLDGQWRSVRLGSSAGEATTMLVECNALVRTLDPSNAPMILQDRAAVLRHQALRTS